MISTLSPFTTPTVVIVSSVHEARRTLRRQGFAFSLTAGVFQGGHGVIYVVASDDIYLSELEWKVSPKFTSESTRFSRTASHP